MQLLAPWKPEEVASLNAYQECDRLHPFTCPQGHILTATPNGWECKECEAAGYMYVQHWCHGWMADWSWKGATS